MNYKERMKYKNQIGQINPQALDSEMIQSHFAEYGTAKCNQLGPSQCKCDCNNDGTEDFSLPMPNDGPGGNWVPNYPQPLSLLHAQIIDYLCCYDMCNTDCFGEQEGFSSYDDEISGGNLGGNVGGGSEGDVDVFDSDITEALTGSGKFSIFSNGFTSAFSSQNKPSGASKTPPPSRPRQTGAKGARRRPARAPQPTRPSRQRSKSQRGGGSFFRDLFRSPNRR